MKYYIYCKDDYYVYQDDFDSDDYSGFCHDGRVNHQFTVSNEPDNNESLLESFETDIENPHFVAIIYSDGGTFGKTDGLVQVLPPVDQKSAALIKEVIKQIAVDKREYVEYDTIERKVNEVREVLRSYGNNVKYFHLNFATYFGSLEDVVIIR